MIALSDDENIVAISFSFLLSLSLKSCISGTSAVIRNMTANIINARFICSP